MESLYEVWSRRNPEWETRYQESIMNVFTDYGRGSTQYQSVRGKYFGAGYEAFIIAFFIGLYFNQTKPLVDDKAKKSHLVKLSNIGVIKKIDLVARLMVRYDIISLPHL